MINGNRLRELRKGNGLTQAKIAEKLNIERTTYVRYEKEEINPPPDMILSMAKLYDVSTDYLLNNTDDPTPPNKKNKPEENKDDPNIVTIQRFYKNSSPKDKEKFMKLLRITFDETFPEDNNEDVQK